MSHNVNSDLIKLRNQIDIVDKKTLTLLAERLMIVSEIGKIKQAKGIKVIQENRWSEVLEKRLELAKNLKLDSFFIIELLNIIHNESIRIQNEKL